MKWKYYTQNNLDVKADVASNLYCSSNSIYNVPSNNDKIIENNKNQNNEKRKSFAISLVNSIIFMPHYEKKYSKSPENINK